MASFLVTNIPITPQSPIKKINPFNTTYSPQTSINEKYYTPQTSIQNTKTPSDSDSTSTNYSLSDDIDHEDFVYTSTKHVHFEDSKSELDIQLKLENNEAEFFAHSPPKTSINNMNKSIRKRDRIRSIFNKKIHRVNSNVSDAEWNEVLAKSLFSMHHDVQEIITGLEETDEPITNDALSNAAEILLTKPNLSFRERQQAKLQMIKIALMLHPPNLLTYNIKESPYPYTDIIEPYNLSFLRMIKQLPDENLFIQHKPFRYKKFRYRTQRGLLRMRHDIKKIKHTLYGGTSFQSHKELPSCAVQNYRNRLEKTLLEVRKQIDEYDRINSLSSTDSHRKSISQVIATMSGTDTTRQAQIEDYRTKLRPIEYVHKKQRSGLNSAPYIPRRAGYHTNKKEKDNNNDRLIDTRFDLSTFVDLNKEAEEFFGPDIPFWDQPPELRLSTSSPYFKRRSCHFIFPSKTGVWDRFVMSFKIKQKKLRNVESIQSEENDDEYFDSISPSSLEKKLQSLLISNNEQSSSSLNEQDIVYF